MISLTQRVAPSHADLHQVAKVAQYLAIMGSQIPTCLIETIQTCLHVDLQAGGIRINHSSDLDIHHVDVSFHI